MSILMFACAVLVLAEPLPEPVGAAPETPESAREPGSDAPAGRALDTPALKRLSPDARALASRRARYVYKLPDNSIWDSFYYIEFRDALKEFDLLGKGSLPSTRLLAWGFAKNRRFPANAGERPHPLWHTLQKPDHTSSTPFIYVNTDLLTFKDKNRAMLSLGKEVGNNVFEFTFKEYPKDEIQLPHSVSFGFKQGHLNLPADLRGTPNKPLHGEFFLVRDRTPGEPDDLQRPRCRLIRAASFRLTPEQYAQALLDGLAELVEWRFTRKPATYRGGPDSYVWSRSIVDVTPTRTASP